MHKVAVCFAEVVANFRLLNALKQRAMPYYAVAAGFNVGIYDTWSSCESQVKGYSKPKYKKFKTKQEAETFLKDNGVDINAIARRLDKGHAVSPIRSSTEVSTYVKELVKAPALAPKAEEKRQEDLPLPEIEDNWPDDVECDAKDDDVLLAAAAEVEGIPEPSKKRKGADEGIVPEKKKYTHDSKIWEPIGLKKIGKFEFPIDSDGYVIVYTDGSCINNGQVGAVAGFGVYFAEGHTLNVAAPVKGRVTNNAGEIQAAIHAIRIAKDLGIKKLCLSTDSQFLINAVTSWIKGWKRRGWKIKSGEPVKNLDDFIILDDLLDGSVDVKWNFVKGHKGIIGNEKADQLARRGAEIYRDLTKRTRHF